MAAKPVAIIMGSQSDWATMKHAADTLDALGIGYEARIVSAHRTPDRLYAFAKGAKDGGLSGDHRRRRRRRAPARHDGGDDHAAGVRACRSNRRRCPGSIRFIRSCRCRPACRSARWRSGAPAPSMPRSSPRACWRLPTIALGGPARSLAQAPDRCGRRYACQRGRRVSSSGFRVLGARRDDRHSRRRPARPHAGDGGGAARLQMPCAVPGARTRPPSTWCAASPRPTTATRPRSTASPTMSTSSPTSSRTCRPRPRHSLSARKPVLPDPKVLAITQDRLVGEELRRRASASPPRPMRRRRPKPSSARRSTAVGTPGRAQDPAFRL